ncbi:MAG: SRPBCC domain-containing protein [Polyangiaceae bacterium]
MSNRDFSLVFTVKKDKEAVFDAILNVPGWWSSTLEGRTKAVDDEFTYRHKKLHVSKHRVTEVVPGERVVWHTLEADIGLGKNRAEWRGTDVRFDVRQSGDETEVTFTHLGLRPELECFEACRRGWTYYVGESLRALITEGRGTPD